MMAGSDVSVEQGSEVQVMTNEEIRCRQRSVEDDDLA